MDTTLRDGEQTSGVSFVPHEKLMIARLLLEDLKVDRIEVASARVSEGEFGAVKMICDWAARRNMLPRVEVLGFVDGKVSVDWIHDAGCRVINLLTKGSEKHCKYQLQKTLDEHIEDIRSVVAYAHERDMDVNVYLEDWSNGIKDSPDYVFGLVDGLRDTGIKRFMLPDTLGILNPLQVIEFMRKMKKRYPDLHFDFHAHNDYDLAVSNVLAAVLSGVKGLHTTINGLGERAGNAPLASVQAILKDHFHAITNIDESRILTEAAIFADRIAVDEETVRLRSHLSQLRGLTLGESPAGRKMDFLIQELNRESNTIGSKCQNADIAHVVVDLKAEIEKIREQIQNVE